MSAVKIYPQLWVAKHASRGELSYLTYYEDNAAFRTRQKTGRKWSKEGDETILENAPLTGFKLGKTVTRWSTNSSYFRILDPRGYEVEINTGNLEMLLRDTVIDHGVIQDECVWGREDGSNVLLTINSQPFKDSIDMGEVAANGPISAKSLKPGDKVRFITGKEMVYVGRFKLTVSLIRWDQRVEQDLPAMHFYRNQWGDKESQYCYESPSGKIAAVLSHGNDVGKLNSFVTWYKGSSKNVTELVKHPLPSRVCTGNRTRGYWGYEDEWKCDYGIGKIERIDPA